MTINTYTFKSVITEYTSIGKLDESNFGGNITKHAVSNIMLNPENETDAKTISEVIEIYMAYTGYDKDKVIKTFFSICTKENSFKSWYKLKVRRRFFKNKRKDGTGYFWSPANIKGEFSEKIKANAIKVGRNNEKVSCIPNFELFAHDTTGQKTECFTGKLWEFRDAHVSRASVQVAVEKLGKHGVQLTLFKYRQEENLPWHSSNYVESVKEKDDFEPKGLAGLFDEEDGWECVNLSEPENKKPDFQDTDEDILF